MQTPEVLSMAVIAYPLTPLVAFAVALTVILCGYVSQGAGLSPGMDYLRSFGWGLMILLWMDVDARKLRRLPCYDFGWLATVCFPLSLLWYCIWSRGWRGGLLMLLILLAMWLAPYFIVAVFSIVQQLLP
jgi:hypothetical protein